MELTGKVAIVTGSASIGQAIALAYAKAGASVVVDYVGTAAAADDTLGQIATAGGISLRIEADVSQPGDVARLIAGTVAKFGEGEAAAEAQLMAEIPLRRWGTPDEVAQLAVYLAADAAACVIVSTFFIDGGMLRNAGSL